MPRVLYAKQTRWISSCCCLFVSNQWKRDRSTRVVSFCLICLVWKRREKPVYVRPSIYLYKIQRHLSLTTFVISDENKSQGYYSMVPTVVFRLLTDCSQTVGDTCKFKRQCDNVSNNAQLWRTHIPISRQCGDLFCAALSYGDWYHTFVAVVWFTVSNRRNKGFHKMLYQLSVT